MKRRRLRSPERVLVLGAGKVGKTLARYLRRAGHAVSLRALRDRPLPRRLDADVVLLCARDPDVARLAGELAGRVSPHSVVLHVAGALGPDVLAVLRGRCAGVGQAHPLASFASATNPPDLKGAHLLVAGDPLAVKRARTLGRSLGMIPRVWPEVDLAAYHAAAGLLGNGATALAAASASLLRAAGAPDVELGRVLGPLLRTVAANIETLGLPAALTGPIRRGDAATVRRHMAAFARYAPQFRELYLSSARAQLALARALHDASGAALDEIARALDRGPEVVRRARRVKA